MSTTIKQAIDGFLTAKHRKYSPMYKLWQIKYVFRLLSALLQ